MRARVATLVTGATDLQGGADARRLLPLGIRLLSAQATWLAYAPTIRRRAKANESRDEADAGLVCPACATPVSARAARCPACGTAITGMASRHVDQTAADFGADQVDATVSGPGDTDGGVPWAPVGPHPNR